MNAAVVIKQGLPTAFVLLLQSITPAVVAVVALFASCAFFGQPLDHYVPLAAIAAFFTLLLVHPPSDLTLRLSERFRQVLGRYALRWAAVIGVLLLIGFVTQLSDDYSRRVMTLWAVTTPLAASVLGTMLSEWLRNLLAEAQSARSVIFAGFNDASRVLAERIAASPASCMRVHGFFDDRSGERLGMNGGAPLLGRLSELATYVKVHEISVIFISLPMRHVQRVMNLLEDLRDTTASIYYVPDVFVFDLIQARTGEILGMPVVAMCETPFHGFRGILKRVTDAAITCGILVPALPVMAIVALLIKLTSPGSVLFKQRRYGLDGKQITVYKFRTMTVSEDGADFKQAQKDDDRITPLGRFLRKYSLDELPQLLNVLQGRMSLVGPRPHPIALNEQYRKLIRGYMVRHKVLPGLTGLAQVNGCRGETAKLEEMQARIHYDLEYLRRWTPLLDLKILFLTAVKVFRDDKAY